MSYNPIPPRVWSRLQGQCNHDTTRTPIEKGNVLQYKKNSSNLTKQQKYSQIAKGYWTSRRKCFASQTQTYTNPNTASFKRINSINIPFPNTIVGAPNNISGPFQYNVPNPFGCPTTVLEDGGTLLGTTYVNPCTNEIIRKTFVQNCNPTSDSDVPGPIETLCWDPSVATWYPRQRLNMSNSSDKWPVGYKGFVSAITPIPPVLYYESCPSTLYWIYEYCLPVSSVNIYRDGELYKVVPAPLTSCPLNDLITGQTYTFTAKSVLYGTESEVSNSVTITIPGPPVNLTSTILSQSSAELSWDLPVDPITNFNIYQNGVLIDTVSPTTDTYVVTGLFLNTLYTFGVSIVDGCGSETTQSTTSLEITEGIEYSNLKYIHRQQVSSDTGSYYIILENDGTDNSPITGPGQTGIVTLEITGLVPLTVYMLIVGGGGGGACGNLVGSEYSGGGGGAGGGIYYSTAITIPINTPVTINVGCAGLGRPANGGIGNSSGAPGGASSLTFSSNTYTANGGGGGFGIGAVSFGGGTGGNGGTHGGGGGGGAGSDRGGPKLGGPGGTGSTLNGNTGTNGTSTSAGNGASSGISTILLPTTTPPITLNLSGGGGGGSNSRNSAGGKGGLAGPSGLGGQNTITDGQNALYGILSTMGYYGNGGGGAGNSKSGGKGSKGVVILWIP